jgi:hypothetical protein
MFPIPFLENELKSIQTSSNLGKILLGDLVPLRFERGFELFPELAELFVIHLVLLW